MASDTPDDQRMKGEVDLPRGAWLRDPRALQYRRQPGRDRRDARASKGRGHRGGPDAGRGRPHDGRPLRFPVAHQAGRGRRGRRRHARPALLRPGDRPRDLRGTTKESGTGSRSGASIRSRCSPGCSRSSPPAAAANNNEAADRRRRGGRQQQLERQLRHHPRRLDGARGASFQAVLDGFKKAYPNVNAKYRPSTNISQDLSTAIEGGAPPDLASGPKPRPDGDYQKRGALKPLDFMKDTVRPELLPGLARPRDDRRDALRPLLQGRQQVDRLVQRPLLRRRRRRARGELGRLPQIWRHDRGVRHPALLDRRRRRLTSPTCSRTSTSREAGPEKYDQLTKHEIPWTDPSVTDALTQMGKLLPSIRSRAVPQTHSRRTSRPR